jgi:predicted alpha/beta superfamily hydrolase
MRKLTGCLILLWIALTMTLTASAQGSGDSLQTRVGFTASLTSRELGQERALFIHLPDEYCPDSTYPLVLLLDGEATFRAFASVTALMGWQGLIPDCIVVGIPNIDRELDYAPVIQGIPESGNAEKMRDFYREELLPFLESRYRVKRKILYGHSWVGFFTAWVMLTEPSLFDGYISSSPMFRFFHQVFPGEMDFGKLEERELAFYLTVGGEEELPGELEEFAASLDSLSLPSFSFRFVVNEGRDHDSNALLSYMDGLEFMLGR